MEHYAFYIGIFAGVCTSISLLPQLIKILKEKKAEDISYGMLFILLTGLSAWVLYGIVTADYPIILTNGVSILVNVLVIVFSVRYKRNSHTPP